MELLVCICGGLNQECDKCAGTGYSTPNISRPVVAFQFPVSNEKRKLKSELPKSKKPTKGKRKGSAKNVKQGVVVQFVNSPKVFTPLPAVSKAKQPCKPRAKETYQSDIAYTLGEALRNDKIKSFTSRGRYRGK